MDNFFEGIFTLIIFFFFFIIPAIINIIKKQSNRDKKKTDKKNVLQQLFENLEKVEGFQPPEADTADPFQTSLSQEEDIEKKQIIEEKAFEHLYEVNQDKDSISQLINKKNKSIESVPEIKDIARIKDIDNIKDMKNVWREKDEQVRGLKKVESFPPLQKAIIYSEILNKPRSLNDY